MFGLHLVQTIRVPGILDALIEELESTPSSSHRCRLIRKLALSHMSAAVYPIVPFLAWDVRVRPVAVEALVSLGEDAREAMLDVLRDPDRRELHAGAVLVLAGLVRADALRVASRGLTSSG
jgi:hypothetical protein